MVFATKTSQVPKLVGRDAGSRRMAVARVLFGLALTFTGVLLGLITGAIQGYFAGKTDLFFQRFMEISFRSSAIARKCQ